MKMRKNINENTNISNIIKSYPYDYMYTCDTCKSAHISFELQELTTCECGGRLIPTNILHKK